MTPTSSPTARLASTTPDHRDDRREGGRWTPLQAAKNHALYAAAHALLFLLRPLSTPSLRRLGRTLGRALYVAGLSPRRIALENLARVYPEKTLHERRALASRAYAQLGSYLGDTVAQLHRRDPFVPLAFEDGSREVLEDALREGHGVLFASAHLGPWERVAGSLVRHGFPLTTLARESYDPRFVGLYDKLRAGVGVRAIYRGSAVAPLQIVRTLRRGGLLGVPMDLRSRVTSVDAPFLGSLAKTPVGPARIALRTGCSVVVGTAVPALVDPRDDSFDCPLALRVTRIPSADLTATIPGEIELTRRVNDELSARIRAFPEAWVWMHPRWGALSDENTAPSLKETR